MSSEQTPTPEELEALHDALGRGIALLERNNRRLQQSRQFLAWGALALAAASTASVFMSEGIVQITLACMQVVLWAGIAALNFGMFPFAEWLVSRRHKQP